MPKAFLKKIRAHHLVLACQFIILASAILPYLLSRGDAYQYHYSTEEYTLEDYVQLTDVVTVVEDTAPDEIFLRLSDISLEKGIYHIIIDYSANKEGSSVQAYSSQLDSIEWDCTPVNLDPAHGSTHLTLDLSRQTDDIMIEAEFSGEGYLSINQISIYETSDLYKQNIFHALVLCVLLGFGYYFMRCERCRKQTIMALTGIFLISCYPLFTDYLLAGHDLPFHLLRIEGIAEGLVQGDFPVKIHPVWSKGFGYAVGVFYGDAALYIPAVLRLIGFSIQTSYQYFVALIQLATVIVSYFCFKRMFSSSQIGLLGSAVYSLSLYRLADVYTRASVGEYTAMLFFPVVLCGFYLIFMESNEKNWRKHSILTAIGLTGLIQSHILSCEMTVLFIALTCIILIRQVCKPRKFITLASGAGLTLLLNLGFLVPFLNYFNEDIMINSSEWTGSAGGTIQDMGLFPLQLFSLFQRSNGGTWSTVAGVSNETCFGLGIVFLIGIALFLYLLLCYGKECAANRNFLPACLSFGLACVAIWMSTCYFPWNAIASLSPVLNKLIVSLQFPWRMLAPATVLLTFVCCFAFSQLNLVAKELPTPVFVSTFIILLLVNAGWYLYDFAFEGEPYRVYDTYELNTMAMYSNDYLPAGTDTFQMDAALINVKGIQVLEHYEKNGTKILCRLTAEDNGGWIEFPLNYYEYYTCRDAATNEELPVSAGTNNMVRVTIPAGFSGTINVFFQEPPHWRISEIVSLLTLLSCIGVYGFFTFKEKSLLSKEKLGL